MIPGLEKVTLIRRKSAGRDPQTGRTTVRERRSSVYLSIQPAPGEVLERMPEGFRANDVKIAYGRTRLRPANPKIQQLSDMIEFDDGDGVDRWEVDAVADWRKILPHQETVLVRIKEPG